jgi:asparagine synthase (glutamine-hydrolysing)
MSVIFGVQKSGSQVTTEDELRLLARSTQRFGPDGAHFFADNEVGIGFQAYHTHQRSKLERRPASDNLGNLLALDGRLDNHEELARLLELPAPTTPDSALMLAAFRRWGSNCFARFVGDWALALWSSVDKTLYLARDHAGTRTLYFQSAAQTVRWSTYLDTFFANGESYSLSKEYAARFLSGQPIRNFTPYNGIRAVPPAHYLAIKDNRIVMEAHWCWSAKDKIYYASEADYDAHFLALFQQSVERRTGSGAPILAELSGGMDSTSIVCVSDALRRSQGMCPQDFLATVSYFDPTESTWNEEPYFSVVEKARGKEGHHIRVSFTDRTFLPCSGEDAATLLPGKDSASLGHEMSMKELFDEHGYRVVLSGLGGDEFLGGIPSPLPELADYLAQGDVQRLFEQALAWSLARRIPLSTHLQEAIRFAWQLYMPARSRINFPGWLNPKLLAPATEPLYENFGSTVDRFTTLPSGLSNGHAWWSVLEALPNLNPRYLDRPEYRFPFLDRDLVDFLFRVPRNQLIRPGQRRALMRRALAGVVPEEILGRRRKAFISRSPLIAFSQARQEIRNLLTDSIVVRYQLLSQRAAVDLIQTLTTPAIETTWPTVIRLLIFEIWLRSSPSHLHPVPGSPPTPVSTLTFG